MHAFDSKQEDKTVVFSWFTSGFVGNTAKMQYCNILKTGLTLFFLLFVHLYSLHF